MAKAKKTESTGTSKKASAGKSTRTPAKSTTKSRSATHKTTTRKPATRAAKPATANPSGIPAAAIEGAATANRKTGTKAASAKSTTRSKFAPPPQGTPSLGAVVIDTSLVAQTAAAMLLNRDKATPAADEQPAAPAKPHSSTIKNIKEQLAKPKPAALSHLLGGAGGPKKSGGGGFNFLNRQKGHNQTYGGFNKTGVPRRTNG
jgi:hypothetical protein